MQKTLGLLCALLALAASARASTIWTGTHVEVDVSAPVHVGIGLEAVTLTAVGLGGALPNAFDGVGSVGDPHTGITTSGDGLHQVFEFGYQAAQTPTLTVISPGDAAYQPIDTHFLVYNAGIIPAPGEDPLENQLVQYTVENPDGGFGNSLTGAFASTLAPTSSWDLAYIVTLPGTTVNLDFYLAFSAINITHELVGASFTIVPEPSALVLLLLGAATVLVARVARRH